MRPGMINFSDIETWTADNVMKWLNHEFSFGSFSLAPLDVLIAIVVFIAIRQLTVWAKQIMERRIFPRTHLDSGVRDSILTFTGYAGTILGLMLGLSIVGVKLSSIALIAGALSVGIGFGLQNIVNNFVSGIILLIERPIKVGDWVVVNGQEGTVTKINVRATEIETFQRASVIIPNADLLQNPVTNWFHQNNIGRVEIPVDIDYSSDIKAAEEALLSCTEGYPGILKNPAPQVLFQDFGSSGLRFELRFHIEDVSRRLVVASEMRKKMFHQLKAAGVSIPFNVVDVRIQGIEELENLLKAKLTN